MPDTLSHYTLLDRLGTGGMGTVWRARDTRDGRIVAVKVLHAHLAADREYVRRFEREARIAQRIDSPQVVRVFEFGQEGEQYFLVMEYVEGKTLAQHVQERRRLSVAETVSIATAIAVGLEAAHRVGIVHRDISPQNVIMQPGGAVKVTDFGVARDLGATAMTATSMLLGKPQYIAPEVVTGQRAADIRTDIYALGVVMYQMLTGAVPFNAETPYAVMQMQVHAPPPPMSRARSDVPAWLAGVVERCLAKRPGERYQTPGALVAVLASGGGDGGGVVAPVTAGLGGRHRGVALLVAGGGLGVLVFGFVLAMALSNDGADEGNDTPGSVRSSANAAVATVTPEQSLTATPPPDSNVTEGPDALPSTGRIAFASTNGGVFLHIFVSDGDGSNRIQLTYGPGASSNPRWSADGGRLAFESTRSGTSQVYVMEADGSNQIRLTHGEAGASDPAWSPDGSRIAFVSRESGDSQIHVMNADGSGQRAVTIDPTVYCVSPSWSPSGQEIAFECASGGERALYLANVGDGRIRRLATTSWWQVDNYTWAPDGERIAFSADYEGDYYMHLINVDGTNRQMIAGTQYADGTPVWSPDGTKIAFVLGDSRNLDIYVSNTDGTVPVRLTDSPAADTRPAWSSDGRYLAFESTRTGSHQIFIMSSDGSGEAQVTTGPGRAHAPVWAP